MFMTVETRIKTIRKLIKHAKRLASVFCNKTFEHEYHCVGCPFYSSDNFCLMVFFNQLEEAIQKLINNKCWENNND